MTSPDNSGLKPATAHGATNARIDAALEHKPQVQIPADFAARIAARAAAQPLRAHRRAPQIGRSIALLSAPLVACALFALAPHASPDVKSVIFDTEVILVAELALIGWWVSRTLRFQDSL
jgi:hypothetical protein